MIRILIADDHRIVREGLKQILADTSDIVVTREAGSAQQLLAKVWKNNYDVVLLDISMPGRSGLDILKELRSGKPHLQILVLTMYPEEQYAVRAFKAGACGYLTKESAPDELIAAIRTVSQGKRYITPSLAQKLAFHLAFDSEKPPHERLSDREYEVMLKIASGKTVKEIADELSLSVKTISAHRAHILKKMGMKHSVEIIRYAIKKELVD